MRAAVLLVLVGCGRFGFDGGTGRSDGGSPGDGNDNTDGTGLNDEGVSIYASAVLADNPAGYWRLGDSSTVARDELGAADGDVQGGITTGAAGAVNDDAAMLFDGDTGRIVVGDFFAFAGVVPYSIELWVAQTRNNNSTWLVHRKATASPDNGWQVYHGDDFCIHSRVADGVEGAYSGALGPLPFDEWTHIVTTYDGDQSRFYVNGEFVQNGFNSAPIAGGTGLLVFGDLAEGQFYKFKGRLDEVAIYDYVLSGSRIRAHYAASGR